MSERIWNRALAAKFTVGVVLSIVAGVVADVTSRHWPTGGTR